MTESSAPAALIPEGYCIMPRRLTAENGAKALLLGEFKLKVTRECPECLELDEPREGCEICDGEGEYAQRQTIPLGQYQIHLPRGSKGSRSTAARYPVAKMQAGAHLFSCHEMESMRHLM
ncbi:hypothetical protein [Pseudomonas alloputida]|uniref:hypothetical protein n=1 Tax=Pseudomonas alloputida TaxID=1940621 RepID=UPI00386689B5